MTRRGLLLGGGAVVAVGAAGAYFAMRGPDYESLAEATWVPRSPDGDPGLDYLVHYATLAANSHNTQPWTFSGSDDRVTIAPDLTRATPVADADNHHLFASLGCAAENLMLAAGAAGKGAEARFEPDGEGAVEIDLAGTTSGEPALFDTILERQCTRSDYDGRAVSADDLAKLEAAARVDGCEVMLISDDARIEQALDLVVAANTVQVENPAFAEELLAWLRFNAAQAAETRDGLYAGCSGNPTLPPWLGRMMFGFAFKPGSENDRYAGQIRSSSGLAVFVSDQDDKAYWVQSGRSYQRFALQATALGIRHAFINQPLEVADIRPQFAAWLGTDRRPDLIVRFGYAEPMPRSLRRPVAEVMAV